MVKTPVVIRDDYIMYLELYDNALWFHTDIKKWSSTVKTKFLEDLNLLQHLTSIPIFALVPQDNKKLQKFGDVTGFTQIQPYLGQDNQMYFIYSRSL